MKNLEINTLNINSNSLLNIATFRQEDNATLMLELYKNGQSIDLTGQKIILGAERSDGSIIEQEEDISTNENIVTIKLKKNILAINGLVKMQLTLSDSEGTMSTTSFNINVDRKILGAENIKASNDIETINSLVLDLKTNVNKAITDTKDKASTLLSGLEDTANSVELKVNALTDISNGLLKNLENQCKDSTIINTELSNNIQQALPINTELKENIKIGQPLVIEATSKNTELQASLEKTKEFINGLDGSQNIPKLRLDVTELQNGLKNNQALAYTGSSISAENTLEGRTESMRIEGRTLLNLVKDGDLKGIINKATNSNSRLQNRNLKYELIPSKTYVGYINVTKYQGNISGGLRIYGNITNSASKIADKIGWNRFTWTIPPSLTEPISNIAIYLETSDFNNNGVVEFDSLMLFEENSQIDGVITYLEGLKSFGESEGNKISILSNGKNLFDIKETKEASSSTVKFSEYDTIEFKQTAQDRVYLKCFGGFKAKTQYTLSLDIVSSKANVKFWIVYDDGTSTKFINSPVTSELGKTILRIQSDAPSGSEEITTIIKNIQLEEGTSKTLYTKPIQYKKEILIKEPLRSKNDKYDILYEDNGQVKIDRYVGIRKYQEGDEKKKEVLTDKINTVYILDKPVTEIVENCVDIDLETYQDKTYFSIENSLPGTLDFKVPSNISSVVQNMAKEVNNIWDVINNLLVPSLIDINKNVAMSTIKNNLK